MRSSSAESPEPAASAAVEDRTAKARIRDAAIDCFAEYGIADTTARRVAAAAGVSPALVIHHFGSMDGLRAACDEHVAGVIRRQKRKAMSSGPGVDVLGALRNSDAGSLTRYLATVLANDSAAVDGLIDDLVADAVGYLDEGERSGTVHRSTDPFGRAAVLTLWSLGALVLHHHVERILGVDLTDPSFVEDPALASYLAPAYEILGRGVFTEALSSRLGDAIAALEEERAPGWQTESSEKEGRA
jgi:AcrR family transcriptional regulator